MRYLHEFKIKCIEAYRQGRWPMTPKGIKKHNFMCMVRKWSRMEEGNSPDSLNRKGFNRNWTPQERLEPVFHVLIGNPILATAIKAAINDRMLYQWVRKCRTFGYDGLVVDRKRDPKSRNQNMKKGNIADPRKPEESEYEEPVCLIAENRYIKAEIEASKMEIALREERHAAILKAKRQRSSRSF